MTTRAHLGVVNANSNIGLLSHSLLSSVSLQEFFQFFDKSNDLIGGELLPVISSAVQVRGT